MRRILMLAMPCMFFASFYGEAQEQKDNLFSLDLSYALTGFLNQGWGAGLNFEKKIFNFFSVTGGFGHMTFLTGIDDVYCASVHVSLFANYYPLSNGLDKLYISIGNGCDFMNYFGSGSLPETQGDSLIHLTPQIGWKFNVSKYGMIDTSLGYKFIIAHTHHYREVQQYVNTGYHFGLSIKILFNEIGKDKRDEQDK